MQTTTQRLFIYLSSSAEGTTAVVTGEAVTISPFRPRRSFHANPMRKSWLGQSRQRGHLAGHRRGVEEAMPIITRYSRPGTSQAMKRMPSAAPNSWSVERAYRRTDSFDRRRWPPSADEAETAIDRDMQHYILVLANSGIRVGEARHLRWRDISSTSPAIYLHDKQPMHF